MAVLFDHDANTGISQYFEYDSLTDTAQIHSTQDVSQFLEKMKQLRNNPDYSRAGMKNDMWHYASIPAIVIQQLKMKGIDVYNKEHHPAMIAAINRDYAHCKVTDKHHE